MFADYIYLVGNQSFIQFDSYPNQHVLNFYRLILAHFDKQIDNCSFQLTQGFLESFFLFLILFGKLFYAKIIYQSSPINIGSIILKNAMYSEGTKIAEKQ